MHKAAPLALLSVCLVSRPWLRPADLSLLSTFLFHYSFFWYSHVPFFHFFFLPAATRSPPCSRCSSPFSEYISNPVSSIRLTINMTKLIPQSRLEKFLVAACFLWSFLKVKARYIFLNFQYATDGSNLLLITGPNMVRTGENWLNFQLYPQTSLLTFTGMLCLLVEWQIHILETNSFASDYGAGWVLCTSGIRFVQGCRSDTFKDWKWRRHRNQFLYFYAWGMHIISYWLPRNSFSQFLLNFAVKNSSGMQHAKSLLHFFCG